MAPHRSFRDTLVVLFRTTFWEEAALILTDFACRLLETDGTENKTRSTGSHMMGSKLYLDCNNICHLTQHYIKCMTDMFIVAIIYSKL